MCFAEVYRILSKNPNDAAKADIWKYYSLVYKVKSSESSETDDSIECVKYLCACNKCLKVYHYKAKDGSSFGTKNLLDHQKSSVGLTVSERRALLSPERIEAN